MQRTVHTLVQINLTTLIPGGLIFQITSTFNHRSESPKKNNWPCYTRMKITMSLHRSRRISGPVMSVRTASSPTTTRDNTRVRTTQIIVPRVCKRDVPIPQKPVRFASKENIAFAIFSSDLIRWWKKSRNLSRLSHTISRAMTGISWRRNNIASTGL